MPKPSAKRNWTVGNPNFATITVEPSAAKKEAGWLVDEKPPREYENWLNWIVDQWIDYFEDTTDTLLAGADQYDAVVGSVPGATHSDLAAALADGSLGSDVRVLVRSPETVNSVIDLAKDGWEIHFHPSAWFTAGTAATCFSISGNRIRMYGARVLNFTTGLEILAGRKNNIIRDFMFNSCTTNIDDQGSNNVLSGNITEA